ncbi:polysaccharide deacetylase family protein [Bacteroides nordii]|uniref:polysaccharide deacetylase family protein n=1 Tax=Bacteroides nordii TaxID=291645 RepID=UPI00210A605D|nr:polysaccharide deacetylase family protein [Bacteroides nordii]MCQ4914174.1 polysaccharide deacetylase family protein [Bacteroides nordii]
MNIAFYLHDIKDAVSFEKQLIWFKKKYRLISAADLRDIIYEKRNISNCCHLTIDDGWLSTYQIIFPLLKKYNIPVSIFVSPEMCKNGKNFWYMEYRKEDENSIKTLLVDEKIFTREILSFPLELIFKEMKVDEVYSILEKYKILNNMPLNERNIVNIDELCEMSSSGLVEIGAHTMSHPILANEDASRSEREIQQSIRELELIIGTKVKSFAYPNGIPNLDFTQREVNFVHSLGIDLAYSVNPGVIKTSTNPLCIPRVGSTNRLKLGLLGLRMPSLHDQVNPRKKIKSYKL